MRDINGIPFMRSEEWYLGNYRNVPIRVQYYNRRWNAEWGGDMVDDPDYGAGYDMVSESTAEEAVEAAMYWIDKGEY